MSPVAGGDGLPPSGANFAHLTDDDTRDALARITAELDPAETSKAIERLRAAVLSIQSHELILRDVLAILTLLPGTVGKVAALISSR